MIYGTTLATNTTFMYDGWNPVARMNETNSAVVESYLRGLDLSGSAQGAAGVGGLGRRSTALPF